MKNVQDGDATRPPSMEADRNALPQELNGVINQLEPRMLAGGQDLLTGAQGATWSQPDSVINLKSIRLFEPTMGWDSEIDAGLGRRWVATSSSPRSSTVDPASRRSRSLPRELHALGRGRAARSRAPQIRSVRRPSAGNLNQRPRCWYYRQRAHAPCLKKGGDRVLLSFEGMQQVQRDPRRRAVVHRASVGPRAGPRRALTCKRYVGRPGWASAALPLEEYYTLPNGRGHPDDGEHRRKPNEVLIQGVHVPGTARVATRPAKSTYMKFKRARFGYDFALSAVALAPVGRAATRSSPRARSVLWAAWLPSRGAASRRSEAILGKAVGSTTHSAEIARRRRRSPEPWLSSENGFKIPLTKALIAKALQKLA